MSDQTNLLKLLEPSVRPHGAPAPKVQPRRPVDQSSFGEMLHQLRQPNVAAEPDQPLKLSAHAQQRLKQRGLMLDDAQLRALAHAADRAEAKGGKDTLMLMDDVAMIVNVPNRTVLTVLDEARMRDGIVTQIDSAVIVNEHARAGADASAGAISGDRLQL